MPGHHRRQFGREGEVDNLFVDHPSRCAINQWNLEHLTDGGWQLDDELMRRVHGGEDVPSLGEVDPHGKAVRHSSI